MNSRYILGVCNEGPRWEKRMLAHLNSAARADTEPAADSYL